MTVSSADSHIFTLFSAKTISLTLLMIFVVIADFGTLGRGTFNHIHLEFYIFVKVKRLADNERVNEGMSLSMSLYCL